MLRLLRIRNFAIIDKLELEFHPGFNAITGETGAGKSIVLDAIALLLGNRANLDVIRTGSDEATVEAIFDLDFSDALKQRFEENDITVPETSEGVLVKRTIHRNGKNKIYFCGELISVTQLSHLCEGMVDLCSQHEHQSLSKPDLQLDLLDRYGGLIALKKKVNNYYLELQSLYKKLDTLGGGLANRAKTEDFLNFQFTELSEFDPKPNEEETLQNERKKLLNSSQLLTSIQEVSSMLGNTDYSQDSRLNLKDTLSKCQQKISKASLIDDDLQKALPLLERAALEIDEVLSFLDTYLSDIETDPHRLDHLEERLNKWSEMKRKYGNTFEEMSLTKEKISSDLLKISQDALLVESLDSEIKNIQKELLKEAEKLSQKRKAVAVTLQKSIQVELRELLMKDARFEIALEKMENSGALGIDRIQFLFSANAGESPKLLSKIASGGELSRVLLSIRRTIADKDRIGVYLFDEIDAGIGGQTASVVGRKLKSVSQFNQVLCITHLPQVAAFADAHFSVSKKTVSGRTISHITSLESKERVEEIARMLGGLDITDKSKAHAKDLMRQAENQKN